ncbi:glycosyltransferase family 4 protein [Vibrio splendidus]|uniref:glycosyltransferase family 4 protein n=1 Tax=Vibrio splendidus TaxID=29497 RepID=UPI00148BADB7|nr:glycosyltransferase family 4 protein [Vibrio splendidus]NOJ10049.1 glycosyltransferase family 4 protein [Vibrio splendidus]
MNILIVTTSLRFKSGPNNVISSLVSGWLEKGHTISLISIKPYTNEERERFSPLVDVQTLNFVTVFSFFYCFFKLREIMLSSNYDVVNSHGLLPDFLLKFNIGSNISSVIHNNPIDDYTFTYGKFRGFIYTKIHAYAINNNVKIFVSKEGYNNFKEKSDNCFYIPNGVSDKFSKIYKKSDSIRRVVFCGHLENRKDPETFLKAASLLIKDDPLIEVNVLGEGSLKQHLESIYTFANFHGFVKNVPEFLNNSDVFVMSSKAEGMPMALLEALSCNLRVVVSDIPSLRILVDDHNIGESFAVSDSKDCYAKIVAVLSNFENYEPRNVYLEHFTHQVMSDSYLKIFMNMDTKIK